MANEDYLAGLPKMTSLQDIIRPNPTMGEYPGMPGGMSASANNIFSLLQAPQAKAMDVMPTIQSLLMGNQAPAIESIRQGARGASASAQSEAMKRGLTGSDIESANMTSALMQGEQQVGQLLSQQASTLAQYIMQAYGMDIASNREMFVTLAQALGQELQSQRDMEQMRLDREAASGEAARARQSSLLGSLIGAGGMIAGGGLAKYSDILLKDHIQKIAYVGGLDIVRWTWNEKAIAAGCSHEPTMGVIAQEVEKVYPELVSMKDGYKMVNYSGLPIEIMAEIERLRG